MKFLNLLPFTKALTLVAIIGFTPAGHLAAVDHLGTECLPTPYAWRENVTPENFDLFWEDASGAIEYHVEVFVNGTLDYSASTDETHIFVEFSTPLQAGDEVEYFITTICEEGYSVAYSGRFSIIDTVDVVMGMNIPPSQIVCNECPYIVNTNNSQGGLFSYYHCPCIQSSGWWDPNCLVSSYSFQVNSCDAGISGPNDLIISGAFAPNPFSIHASAQFKIEVPCMVNMSILDFNGAEVLPVIENEYCNAGSISVTLDGSTLEKGIYYYVVIMGETKKIGRIVKL